MKRWQLAAALIAGAAFVAGVAVWVPPQGVPSYDKSGDATVHAVLSNGSATGSATAKDESNAVASSSREPDALDQQALEAQQGYQAAQEHVDARANLEDEVQRGIDARVNEDFRAAIDQLAQSGIAFESPEQGFNTLSFDARVVQQLPGPSKVVGGANDRVWILRDAFESSTYPIALLKGARYPSALKWRYKGAVVGADGRISASCQVTFDGYEDVKFACPAVISGTVDGEIAALAKKDLVDDIREMEKSTAEKAAQQANADNN